MRLALRLRPAGFPGLEPMRPHSHGADDRGDLPSHALRRRWALLDESFESYLEDVDFGLRCAVAGRRGIYVPQAVAYHRGSASGDGGIRTQCGGSPAIRYCWRESTSAGNRVWPIVAGQLLWGLVAFRHGRGFLISAARFQGLGAPVPSDEAHVGEDVVVQPQSPEIVRAVLEESERQIFELQRQTGFDSYWRAYFWLLPR